MKKTKRKVPASSDKSAAEPVVKRTKRPTSPGDPRANLRILNPTAGKNTATDVVTGYKLQIRYGRNGSLYNAKVTKVLNDGFVMVCTGDEDPGVAKKKFKLVRLTEEQAKSDKAHGFTKGCANVGFAVAGAHDS